MYHPISSKMENYSAPTGRLWFMYSNLELFRVQKACLYTAAEGQIANRTGTFTLALLGSKLTSLWAAGANSPQTPLKWRDRNSGETEEKTLKNSLTPDFSLGCEARDNKPQRKRCLLYVSLRLSPRTARHRPDGAHQPDSHPPWASQTVIPSLEHPAVQQ